MFHRLCFGHHSRSHNHHRVAFLCVISSHLQACLSHTRFASPHDYYNKHRAQLETQSHLLQLFLNNHSIPGGPTPTLVYPNGRYSHIEAPIKPPNPGAPFHFLLVDNTLTLLPHDPARSAKLLSLTRKAMSTPLSSLTATTYSTLVSLFQHQFSESSFHLPSPNHTLSPRVHRISASSLHLPSPNHTLSLSSSPRNLYLTLSQPKTTT